MKSQKYILAFCTLFAIGCSSNTEDEPKIGQEPTPKPLVFDSLNSINQKAHLTQMFVSGNGARDVGKTADGKFIPAGIGLNTITDMHIDASNGTVEEPNIITIFAQAIKTGGDGTVEEVGLGSSVVDNIGITFVKDSQLEKNIHITISNGGISLSNTTLSLDLNPNHDGSKQITNEPLITITPLKNDGSTLKLNDGTAVESIEFSVNKADFPALTSRLVNYDWDASNDGTKLLEEFNNFKDNFKDGVEFDATLHEVILTIDGNKVVSIPEF